MHTPRAHRHAHQPRSPLLPALSRPTALPSPAPNTHLSGQPQDLPIMEGAYTCQPGARSLCLPLPVCAYILVPRPPGPLGQPTTPTSREFLQLGHSSPLLQVSPTRGPPPQHPEEPHSDPSGQLISGSLPYTSLQLSPLALRTQLPPNPPEQAPSSLFQQGGRFPLPLMTERDSPTPCDRGRGQQPTIEPQVPAPGHTAREERAFPQDRWD